MVSRSSKWPGRRGAAAVKVRVREESRRMLEPQAGQRRSSGGASAAIGIGFWQWGQSSCMARAPEVNYSARRAWMGVGRLLRELVWRARRGESIKNEAVGRAGKGAARGEKRCGAGGVVAGSG